MDAENTTKPSRAYAAGKKFSLGTQGPSPRMRSEYAGVDTSAAAATLSSGDAVASYMNGGGLKAASGAGSGAPGGGNVNDGGDRALRATASDNVHVIHGAGGRLVCVSDIRGQMQRLNEIALETRASAIVHTGDFGFYTQDSIERMGDRTLRHVVQYSPLLSSKLRQVLLESSDARDTHPPLTNGPVPATLRQMLMDHRREAVLSEFAQLLSGQVALQVPVFTVYGACEDVEVVERVRSGEYNVPNLHLVNESTTHAVDIGSLRVRLLGLGGAVVPHKLFDHGAAPGTMAGGQGTMWTTMLQVGELVESAQHVYDPTEVRVLITYGAPGRDVLLDQLAHAVHADFTMSGSLHLRYVTSYNDFGVYGSVDTYRAKVVHSKNELQAVWDAVRTQVESAIDPSQRTLLNHALHVALHVPQSLTSAAQQTTAPPSSLSSSASPSSRGDAFKNMWHWNLPDANVGSLVLDVAHGRISTEMRSQGISFTPRPRRNGPPIKVDLPSARERDEHEMKGARAASPPSAATLSTLFLGHLGEAHPVTEQDVHAYFGERASNIVQVHFFPSDRDRRAGDKDEPRMRNFVHVVFKNEDAAKDALQHCQGHTIKGTSVVPTLERLERSRTKPSRVQKEKDETGGSGRTRSGRRGRGGRGGRGRNSGSTEQQGSQNGQGGQAAPSSSAAPPSSN